MTAGRTQAPKAPPHDLSAEASLLGAMMLSRAAVTVAMDAGVTPSDLYRPQHAQLFEVLARMAVAGVPIDVVTVAAETDVMAPADLIELQAGCGSIGSAGRYAAIILDHAARRRVMMAARELAEAAGSGAEYDPSALAGLGPPSLTNGHSPLVMADLADINRERVEWFWLGRIPRGKLTILAGDPGAGKSWLAIGLCAAATGHVILPGAERMHGEAVYLSFEDAAGDTVGPRADMMGVGRGVYVQTAMHDPKGRPAGWGLGQLVALRRFLTDHPGVNLVIVDGIMDVIGSGRDTDINRANDVRASLGPWVEMAATFGVALVGILHLRKSEAERVLYRVSGNIAFAALARSVLLAGVHPDSGRRSVAPLKMNLAAHPSPVEYTIDEDGLHWLGEADDLAADALLAPRRQGREPVDRNAAADWLSDFLGDREHHWQADVQRGGESAGHNYKTLVRAADELGVVRARSGNGWTWTL